MELSEILKREVKDSGRSLQYFSEISGLTKDYISKMCQGKRMTKDEKKFKDLIEALQCSQQVKKELLRMYKVEKIGQTQWNCFEQIQCMLEKTITFQVAIPEKQIDNASICISKVEALQSKTDICLFLQNILNVNTKEKIYLRILMKRLEPSFVALLLPVILHKNVICEHIFPFMQNKKRNRIIENREKEDYIEEEIEIRNSRMEEHEIENKGIRYNIELINQIMPLIQANTEYKPYYYYEVEEMLLNDMNLITNWIILDKCVIGIAQNMEQGIVLHGKEQIYQLIELFEQRKEKAKKLVHWFQNIEHLISHVKKMQYKIQYDEKAVCYYYLETNPYILSVVPEAMIKKHLLLEESKQKDFLLNLKERLSQYRKKNIVHFFTLKGLENFIKKGTLYGISEELYKPFNQEECNRILHMYLDYIKKGQQKCYIINSEKLKLASGTAIFCTPGICNSEAFYICMNQGNYCSIEEFGITKKVNEFFEFMVNENYIYSEQDTIKYIDSILINETYVLFPELD